MAPSEQFWQLLLGEEMASACSAVDRGHGFGKDEAMKLGDFWGTNKHAVPSKPKHETAYSEQLDAHHRTQLDMAKSLGIEEFLKMASDDLCRQPALLHTQVEKLVNVQDELAVQNCSLFLASSKALSNLSSSINSLSATLAEMEHCIQPLHSCLKQFGTESNAASTDEASLHTLVSTQSSVSGLLDLPSLVLKCSNGGLHDEAVDALMLADERITSLRASGCGDMPLVDFLEMQMKEARTSCMKTLLRLLGQHAQLSPSMKLIGPLRRLSCSEEQLRMQYLRRRDAEISRQRRNAEGSCETDPAHGLCAASELLRVDVLQTAINYRAIFGSTDGRLSAWLAEQVHWFVTLVDKELLQRSGITDSADDFKGIGPLLDLAALEASVAQANLRNVPNFRVGLLDLATIFRQVYNAASAFRRVQCYFFPVVALAFDRYVAAVHRQRVEGIAVAFSQSIDEYDWLPSTAHLSLLGASPWFHSALSANRSCVFLLRHAPLSNLYNSTLEVANAFQECPISTTAAGVMTLIRNLLALCIRKLISVKPGSRGAFEDEINAVEHALVQKESGCEGSAKRQAEFFVLCDIFATVLLPAVAKQLSSTFPVGTDLDTEELRLLMEEADLCHIPNPFMETCSTCDQQATDHDCLKNASAVVP